MIRNIEFKTVRDEFQSKLSKDVKDIRSSDKVLVFADKGTNLYEMDKCHYNKLLGDNITKTYKKCDPKVKGEIDKEAKVLAGRLGLGEKMECMAERQAFVTLKDHKDNFRSDPKCRLINPAKSEMGYVSKGLLDNVISKVADATGLNQWRNTNTVISWFKSIPRKSYTRFIKFDICEFYPSISEVLLDKAIKFAQTYTEVGEEVVTIVKHARKSLLFNKPDTWIKKDGDGLFDVTMGSFDGAEICELVELYLLHRLTSVLEVNSVDLYRDDGLAAVRTTSGRKLDKLRKDITELFKKEGLSITIDANLLVTDFLDVTFDLPNNKFYPFRKPDNKPMYIHARSNHPQSILKVLPDMINRRICDLSCNEDEFDKAKGLYESALKDSGYSDTNFRFEEQSSRRRKARNRKVIWFNPPFSRNVKTNVGSVFLGLVRKHFTNRHHFNKIFNTSTLKLSYSCMTNMQNIIKQNNMRVMSPASTQCKPCNCRNQADCPLNGECRSLSTVYRAAVEAGGKEHVYYGTSDGEIKERISTHNTSFKHRKYEHDTTLSKFIWSLKDKGVPYSIEWGIAARAGTYKCGTRRCDLCLTEKMTIARSKHKGLLNSRSELISKCRHRNKFALQSVES